MNNSIRKALNSNKPQDKSFLQFDSANGLNSGVNKTELFDRDRMNKAYKRQDLTRAISQNDINTMREISVYFYGENQLYARMVDFYATMPTFYWMVVPRRAKDLETDSLLDKWWNVLDFIEVINPEVLGEEVMRKAVLEGEAYVAVREKIKDDGDHEFGAQFLPNKYCRVTARYKSREVVDFNVKFFDEIYSNPDVRLEAMKNFPDYMVKAYNEWNEGPKASGMEWAPLDPNYAFRFSLRPDGRPILLSALFDLLDLEDVKSLTMLKLEQELSKILVQHFGTDKDGHPIVDFKTMEMFHSGATSVVGNLAGVDVITTLADISEVNLQENSPTASNHPMKIATEAVHSSAGIAAQLLNPSTAGTLSLSLIVNETTISRVVKQFQDFLNVRVETNYNKKGKDRTRFNVMVPLITHYNKEKLSKLYKEQTALGYSKFLPAIALGERQSDILSIMEFENSTLDLVSLMIPPASSNTMSSSDVGVGESGAGRPELEATAKSEKTEQNEAAE